MSSMLSNSWWRQTPLQTRSRMTLQPTVSLHSCVCSVRTSSTVSLKAPMRRSRPTCRTHPCQETCARWTGGAWTRASSPSCRRSHAVILPYRSSSSPGMTSWRGRPRLTWRGPSWRWTRLDRWSSWTRIGPFCRRPTSDAERELTLDSLNKQSEDFCRRSLMLIDPFFTSQSRCNFQTPSYIFIFTSQRISLKFQQQPSLQHLQSVSWWITNWTLCIEWLTVQIFILLLSSFKGNVNMLDMEWNVPFCFYLLQFKCSCLIVKALSSLHIVASVHICTPRPPLSLSFCLLSLSIYLFLSLMHVIKTHTFQLFKEKKMSSFYI